MSTYSAISSVPLLAGLDAPELLNLLADGAYITDRQRRIVFWNTAAERITGWPAEEVVGRGCHDNILMHVDKDGHPLCGHEHCPLHRSIVTGQPSPTPLLVFAQHKRRLRTPVEVMVSPVRNHAGEVIGGIEVFRDLTEHMQDQLRAQRIQAAAVSCQLPSDERVEFETCYQPRDIVGGDFYRIECFEADQYALLIADAMGHGVAAALNTIQLRSLWNDHRAELRSPARFIEMLNNRLHALVQREG
jgi:phosphoserine phosphatase RsbU/P